MKTLYLVTIVDHDGDSDQRLVSQATWDWISSPCPDFKGETSIDEVAPIEVREEYFRQNDQEGYYGQEKPTKAEDVIFFVTTGSWRNDRALNAPYLHMFGSTKELFDFCQENEIEIGDEYSGLMY